MLAPYIKIQIFLIYIKHHILHKLTISIIMVQEKTFPLADHNYTKSKYIMMLILKLLKLFFLLKLIIIKKRNAIPIELVN